MALNVIKETNLGVYVATSGGVPIDDGDGHVLAIASREHDIAKIAELQRAAKALGYEDLGVEFVAGARPVSDEEYIIQQQRLEAGLTPDPYDYNESVEAYRRATNGRNG